MRLFLTILIISINYVVNIEAEFSVGDSCVVYKDGSNGICSYISDCHISHDPKKVISNTGVCFYPRQISPIPVVCCPAKYTRPFESNQRPIGNEYSTGSESGVGVGGNQYQTGPSGIEFPTENSYEIGNQRPTGNEYPIDDPYQTGIQRPSIGNEYNTGNQYQPENQLPSSGNEFNTGNQYQIGNQRPRPSAGSGYNTDAGNQYQTGNQRPSTGNKYPTPTGSYRPNNQNYPEISTQVNDPIIFPTENYLEKVPIRQTTTKKPIRRTTIKNPNIASTNESWGIKSAEKCAEYSRLVTNFIAPLPLLPNPEPTSVAVPKCNFDAISLIVGGTKAKVKEFPHMAALGYNVDGDIVWQCGGTLISEEYVLTAAHCTHSRDRGAPIKVRLGDLNLESDNDGARPETLDIIDIIQHHHYLPPAKYNDIALIRLSRRVQFNDYIRPACLWNSFNINYTRTVATGWGQVGFADDPSPHLLKVGLDIVDTNQCQQYYQGDDRILPNGIDSKSMICSGVLTGGKDTCLGDSGGPIVVSNQKNHCLFYVIGVTSFGKACALVNSPGVYTRVSNYVQWIEDQIWK